MAVQQLIGGRPRAALARRASATALALVVLLAGASAAAEPEAPEPPPAASHPPAAGDAAARPLGAQAEIDRLAADGGRSLVIVGLDVPGAAVDPDGAPLTAAADARAAAAVAAAQGEVVDHLAGTGATVVRTYRNLPALSVEVGAEALERLRTAPGVTSVQEDVPERLHVDSSVPVLGGHLAHVVGRRGTGWAVAVVDTGVDRNHPALRGRVVAEACFSVGEDCPNGARLMGGSGAARPCGYAECDHGTHVAGIAAGAATSGGGAGVAPGAPIIAVNVFSYVGCSGGGCTGAYTTDTMAALDWIYSLRTSRKIAAVNMSLGGGASSTACDSEPRKPAIDRLRSAGIATVVSAGNEGYSYAVSAPACISSAIAVGSTTRADQVSGFSNAGTGLLDFWAPGDAIRSSVPGSGYATKSGTSMAAPHIAGAWALMRQRYPSDSVSSIQSRLQGSGVRVTDPINSSAFAQRPYLPTAMGIVTSGGFEDQRSSSVLRSGLSTGVLSGTTAGATHEVGEPAHGGGGNRSVWWRFEATESGLVTLLLQGRSPDVVRAYQEQGASLVAVTAGEPDQVAFRVRAGSRYAVVVDSVGSSSGPFHLARRWDPSAFVRGPSVDVDGTYRAVPGDFDGDGRHDVLWYAAGSRSDALWRGTVGGFANGPGVNVVGSYQPVVGDYDGDGRDDVIWYAPGSPADAMWRGTPTGFTPGWPLNLAGSYQPLVGDYDGDGYDDVLWYAPGPAKDTLWRGTAGGFTPGPAVNLAGSYRPAVGDYDGDGRDDVLWYAPGPAKDTLWRGTAGGFTPGPAVNVAGHYRPVVGDYDGLEGDDVLWYAGGSAPDSLWRGQASGFRTGPPVSVSGSYQSPVGDYDGDGRADVLWYAPGPTSDSLWRGS